MMMLFANCMPDVFHLDKTFSGREEPAEMFELNRKMGYRTYHSIPHDVRRAERVTRAASYDAALKPLMAGDARRYFLSAGWYAACLASSSSSSSSGQNDGDEEQRRRSKGLFWQKRRVEMMIMTAFSELFAERWYDVRVRMQRFLIETELLLSMQQQETADSSSSSTEYTTTAARYAAVMLFRLFSLSLAIR
jgi:hypothetical protein